MATAHSQHRAGIALVVAAAVAWSTAPFFTRLLPFDSWTILFWRGLFGGVLIAAILVLMQGRAGLRDLTGVGRNGWLVAPSRHWAWSASSPPCSSPAYRMLRSSSRRGPLSPRQSPGYGCGKPRDGKRNLPGDLMKKPLHRTANGA
jgi:hypothetical protein